MISSKDESQIATGHRLIQVISVLCLVMCGVPLTNYTVTQLYYGCSSLRWQACPGKILSSKLVPFYNGDGLRSFKSQVGYEFEMHGRILQGDLINYHLFSPTDGIDPTTLPEFKPLTQVNVYCNPENPSESCLEPGPDWRMGPVYVILVCFIWFLVYWIGTGRRIFSTEETLLR
jgi:hypothetical protein